MIDGRKEARAEADCLIWEDAVEDGRMQDYLEEAVTAWIRALGRWHGCGGDAVKTRCGIAGDWIQTLGFRALLARWLARELDAFERALGIDVADAWDHSLSPVFARMKLL